MYMTYKLESNSRGKQKSYLMFEIQDNKPKHKVMTLPVCAGILALIWKERKIAKLWTLEWLEVSFEKWPLCALEVWSRSRVNQ